jgi:hypothetical protein
MTLAPAAETCSAASRIWSRFSTLQGPAIRMMAGPPISMPPTLTTVPPGRKLRLASL